MSETDGHFQGGSVYPSGTSPSSHATMKTKAKEKPLAVDLPFDEAIRRALGVPPEKPAPKKAKAPKR